MYHPREFDIIRSHILNFDTELQYPLTQCYGPTIDKLGNYFEATYDIVSILNSDKIYYFDYIVGIYTTNESHLNIFTSHKSVHISDILVTKNIQLPIRTDNNLGSFLSIKGCIYVTPFEFVSDDDQIKLIVVKLSNKVLGNPLHTLYCGKKDGMDMICSSGMFSNRCKLDFDDDWFMSRIIDCSFTKEINIITDQT